MRSMYQAEQPLMKMSPDADLSSFNPQVSYKQQGDWFKSEGSNIKNASRQKKSRRRKP
ncbi:hypothetical protein BDE36_0576 [Arcticibacter tournemirensis]|uniref:hypothetical protein n=1 Tax=Arcticibacter tournemirensis TaxID=699437 RepID=UPI0011714198|nr:hypothetical protein [Arcticibacter tournemirensis]TQM48885.1 hypothetical protein BDE36_0576 [Arcticibacter tournemirensis]